MSGLLVPSSPAASVGVLFASGRLTPGSTDIGRASLHASDVSHPKSDPARQHLAQHLVRSGAKAAAGLKEIRRGDFAGSAHEAKIAHLNAIGNTFKCKD